MSSLKDVGIYTDGDGATFETGEIDETLLDSTVAGEGEDDLGAPVAGDEEEEASEF